MSEFDVYPNPNTTGVLNIESFNSTGKIDIINMDGKVLYTNNLSIGLNSYNIKLESGIYIIVIYEKNGDITNKKLVIQ